MLYISLCSATDAAHGERDVAHAKQETSICEVRKLKLHIHISSRAEHTHSLFCVVIAILVGSLPDYLSVCPIRFPNSL